MVTRTSKQRGKKSWENNMANAGRDANGIPTKIGVLDTDGTTTTQLKVNPTTHETLASNGTLGSDLSGDNAARDANGVTAIMALSNVDGITPVPLYINASGEILVKST